PNAMAGVERSVRRVLADRRLLRLLADGLDMFEIFVKATDALAAVTVHHIDVAIRRNRHVSWIRPIKFLRRASFLGDVADLVKDFAFEVGLIDALAELWPFLVRADVFGEVNEFLSAFLAHIEAMRRVLDL